MKPSVINYIILLIVFLSPEAGRSNNPNTIDLNAVAEEDSLVLTKTLTIHSDILNEDRTIRIALPENYYLHAEEITYPIFLLLEDQFFQVTAGVIKHLSSVERIPEFIVVSLVDGPLTPKVFTNGSNFWQGNKTLGRGSEDLFTQYLQEELFPYLKENYRANDFSVVMGTSYSSIYPLHTFTKEPNLFDAHIALASGDILSMGYVENGKTFIDLFVDDLRTKMRTTGYLYVTSAERDGGTLAPEINENLIALDKRLKPYQSEDFHFISKPFPNEGHYDVVLPGLMEALNMIFPIGDMYARYRELIAKPGEALNNIDAHYQKLSDKYGFEIWPRAERWRSGNRLSWVGPYLLRQGRTDEAIEVIERWISYRPHSHKAYAELSKAFEKNEQFSKAIAALKNAINLSSNLSKDTGNSYKERLLELEAKGK